jgi:hypothetical protein
MKKIISLMLAASCVLLLSPINAFAIGSAAHASAAHATSTAHASSSAHASVSAESAHVASSEVSASTSRVSAISERSSTFSSSASFVRPTTVSRSMMNSENLNRNLSNNSTFVYPNWFLYWNLSFYHYNLLSHNQKQYLKQLGFDHKKYNFHKTRYWLLIGTKQRSKAVQVTRYQYDHVKAGWNIRVIDGKVEVLQQ